MNPIARLSSLALLPVAVGAILCTPEPAAAQLSVCNRSSETVSMTIAYREDGKLVSRGWYVAGAGECSELVSGALQARYYYVRAEGNGGHTWGDDYAFCVQDSRFTHTGEACSSPAFERRAFFQIDTGQSRSWTQDLTINASPTREDAVHEAIAGLRLAWRPSFLEEGTYVMQLHNGAPTSVDVNLKCFTRGGSSKVLVVSVPARGTSEVGFLEGWPGNFVTGESCEAYHGSEFVWRTVLK